MRLTLSICHRQYSKSFTDRLRIYVKAGNSGVGYAFKGGIGGNGGSVYMVASPDPSFNLLSLKNLYPTKRFKAPNGNPSTARDFCGRPGKNIFIPVPHGVSIVHAETNKLIGDIEKAGDKVLVEKGARGGNRSTNFEMKKTAGRSVYLDLKILADIGFVGFPNAGKSTLLNNISNARPEVADYPFTTLRPYVGVVEYEDFRRISCADLPGLIEGASFNEGMGHQFLKHIERTKVLLFVVDLNGFSMTAKTKDLRSPLQTVQLLARELELYNKEFLKRPAVLALNKTDTLDENKVNEINNEIVNWQEDVREKNIPNMINFKYILNISAKEREGLQPLKDTLRQLIDDSIVQRTKLPKYRKNRRVLLETRVIKEHRL